MLRKLKIPIVNKQSKDMDIACAIIDILFRHVYNCINENRSSVKLNMFQRGMIGGVLGNTRDGTKSYVHGMTKEDVSILLDDLEKELKKRRK